MNAERTRGEPVTEHYDRLAPHFVEHWAYSPEFVDWMTGRLASWLRLDGARRLLDVGCGPGLYARRLAAYTSGPVTCVDPSSEMLAQLPATPQLLPLKASADEVAASLGEWDAILLKESVHHTPAPQRRDVLHRLVRRLAPGGQIVLVMMPIQQERPLPASARGRLQRARFTPAVAADVLAETGLTVTTGDEDFEVTLLTARYAAMLEDRYMSLLDQVSETELERTITELGQHGEQLTFRDRYAFIAANA